MFMFRSFVRYEGGFSRRTNVQNLWLLCCVCSAGDRKLYQDKLSVYDEGSYSV